MLLLTKAKNALELFWDSLDTQERAVVAYLTASALLTAWSVVSERSWERRKAELAAELRPLVVDFPAQTTTASTTFDVRKGGNA